MKTKALYTILSQKVRDGEVLFVDSLAFDLPKTKEAKEIITQLATNKGYETLATKRKNTAFIAIDGKKANTKKSFDNFGNIKLDEVRNMNPIDLLTYKFLIIENPDASIKQLEARMK